MSPKLCQCMMFEDGYLKLASLSRAQGYRLFYIRPKLHQFMHLVVNLGCQKSFVANPISYLAASSMSKIWAIPLCMHPPIQDYSCWSDEDLVGKVARLGRTVHPMTHGLRTLEKSLGMYKAALDRLQ